MAAEYQQLLDPMTQQVSTTVLRRADNAHIPDDPVNRDRQTYNSWLAEGNVPDAPDPLPTPSAPPPDPNARLDAGIQAAAATMSEPPSVRQSEVPGAPVSQDDFAALTARVDQLQQAMGDMLRAQDYPRAVPHRRT